MPVFQVCFVLMNASENWIRVHGKLMESSSSESLQHKYGWVGAVYSEVFVPKLYSVEMANPSK